MQYYNVAGPVNSWCNSIGFLESGPRVLTVIFSILKCTKKHIKKEIIETLLVQISIHVFQLHDISSPTVLHLQNTRLVKRLKAYAGSSSEGHSREEFREEFRGAELKQKNLRKIKVLWA